jgi:hypothetical protein
MKQEKLKQKLEQITAQKEAAIGQVNALIGAENMLKELIAESEEGEQNDE